MHIRMENVQEIGEEMGVLTPKDFASRHVTFAFGEGESLK